VRRDRAATAVRSGAGRPVGWRPVKRIGRAALFVLVALLALGALPAIAEEDAESGDAAGDAAATVESPAVEVAEDAPEESIADWTYRYMIPLTLVLAAAVMVGMSIRYFTKVVRRRYRIVEE